MILSIPIIIALTTAFTRQSRPSGSCTRFATLCGRARESNKIILKVYPILFLVLLFSVGIPSACRYAGNPVSYSTFLFNIAQTTVGITTGQLNPDETRATAEQLSVAHLSTWCAILLLVPLASTCLFLIQLMASGTKSTTTPYPRLSTDNSSDDESAHRLIRAPFPLPSPLRDGAHHVENGDINTISGQAPPTMSPYYVPGGGR